MRKFTFLALILLSLSAQAMWIEEYSPRGEEVDLKVDSIRIKFSSPLIKLGETGPVKPEQLSHIKFGNVNCDAHYEGTNTIVCKLKSPLVPSTKYELSIEPGFQGLTTEERFHYKQDIRFSTSPLSVTSYHVEWKGSVPHISVDFNLKVKAEGRSGVIQCEDRNVNVVFEPLKDKKGEETFKLKAESEIKTGETCFFYFNRPLSYRDHVGSFVPEQKIVIDQSVESLEGNYGTYDFRARCAGNYHLDVNLFAQGLSYLRCEFNDQVNIEIPLASSNQSININSFVKVLPKGDVKVSYDGERIMLQNLGKPNQSYIVKISKSIPLYQGKHFAKDVVFQLETLDNPPLISPYKRVGVIEREGPWKIAYSALNVKSVDLLYSFLTKPEELAHLQDLAVSSEKLKNKKLLNLDSKENVNELLPLDVKKLAEEEKFKAGLFTGRMKAHDIDQKYLNAEGAIFSETSQITDRKEFSFGYLFTDIGLHVKKGKQGILVWATSLKTGKPLEDVAIRVIGKGGSDDKATTNDKGIAFLPDVVFKREEEFTVVAKLDDDISFITNKYGQWNSGISMWDFNLGYHYQDQGRLVVDIVAERPLYLPNEKVHLKFFIRRRIPDSLELENSGKKIRVSIFDSRGNEALVQHIELNSYGTATLEYQLPVKAPTGRYAVYLQDQEATINLDSVFQVEEFRKPEFKVVMEETPGSYDGKITYFKGGPVKNTSGEMAVIFKKVSFRPTEDYLNRFWYPSSISSYWDEYGSGDYSELKILSRTEIESDDKGEFSFSKKKITGVEEYGTLIVEAAFRDENGGNIAGRVDSKINPFHYIPGIDLTRWMYNTGEKIEPEVVAINKEGKPESGVKMNLKVIKVTYIYERRLGSGNYFYYDSRREEKEVKKCSFVTTKDFKSCEVELDEAGYYDFVAEVADKKLKAEGTKTSTYVYAKGEFLGFEATNHDRINLSVDSSKLKLGDTLKVMAISPLQDGEALITFERDGILYSEQVSFKGNVVLYEKKITDEKLIPGFFVSVVIVKGRTSEKIENQVDLGKPAFKIGYRRIEVANTEKRLVAKVTPAKKQLEPGQMMEATIEIKDHKGKGVQGELAIAVVDDALLTLSGPYQKNYDILDTFYTLGTHGVENFQTLTQLIGRRTFGKKGANAGGGGGFEIRSNFKNTAFWEAQGETDKDGKYKVSFKVPDNLTTWKIIAVAVDKEHRFGMGESEFLVSKSLMIEPALPNFLVEGDKFNAKVVVTNRSGKEQKVKVEAKSSQLVIQEKTQNLTIKDDDKASAFFPMSVGRTKSTDVTFTAQGDKAQDGFKIDIPVNSGALNFAFANYGILDGKKDIPLSINPKAYPESLNLTVKATSTALQGLDEVFRYVLHYPYGCWEQRLTAAYFLVQYEAFKDQLTFRFAENKGTIKSSVQNLLNLAPDYQTANGGLRYYPGGSDSPDVYLSVFTAQSFVMMKKMGYTVDAKVEENLKNYLKNLLSSEQNWNSWYVREARSATRAMILNVLSEMGEKNLSTHVSKLYSDRNALDLFGLGQLAGTLHTQKGFEKEATLVFDKLISLKEVTADRASLREPLAKKGEDKYWNYTQTRSVCAVMQNMVSYSNDKALMASLVRGAMGNMKGGHWYNTQENIFCFEALRRYVEKFEKKGGSQDVKVALDGKEIKTAATVTMNNKELKPETKKVTLEPKEKSELYYSTVLRYETPYEARAKTSAGFELTKKIERFDPVKKTWSVMIGETLNIKRGDNLRITLEVKTPDDRHQVMLNDQLAGGLEPVNTQLATASVAAGSMASSGLKKYEWETPYYRGNGFEYMDLRLDAAQFYSRHIPKGTYSVEYIVQAIATGEFLMPESTIEEMYYPDVRATEIGRKIIIHE